MLKQASAPQQPALEPTTSLCSNGPKGLRARSAACGAANQSDARALEPCLRILPPKKESEHVRRRQTVIYLPAAMLTLLCAGVWERLFFFIILKRVATEVSFHDCGDSFFF